MGWRRGAFFLLVAVFLSACGTTFEVGVERPTVAVPAPSATPNRLLPTIEALQGENERLRAELAARASTPTPEPPALGRVAYVQGGDIWVKQLPDGNAQRLTSDGRNSEPRWSASGRWLAFRKERSVVIEEECDLPKPQRELCRESVWQRQLWVVAPDEGMAGLLNDGLTVAAFAWSPAADQLAYVDATGALRVTAATGGRAVKLAGGVAQGVAGALAWSLDGRWIGYEYATGLAGAAGYEQGVWKVAPDGVPIPLYSVRDRAAGSLRLVGWDASGESALLWDAQESPGAESGALLYRLSADGASEPVRLAETAMLPERALLAVGRDVTALIFGAERATWRDKRLALLTGEDATEQLAEDAAVIQPAWSPDGMRLAYAAMREREGVELGDPALPEMMARRIYVVDAARPGEAAQLTDAAEYRDERPLWSTDGRFILFARLDGQGRASLWLIPSVGGVAVRVVDEITPAPDPLGAFGLISWEQYFDWARER